MSDRTLPQPIGSEPIHVSAIVTRWQLTKTSHPYGFAKFVLNGEHLEVYCNRFYDGEELPLNTPFECVVAVVNGRPKVTGLRSSVTEESLGLEGRVVSDARGWQSMQVEYGGKTILANIPPAALGKSIHAIVDGALMSATVSRKGSKYTVVDIASPTAVNAIHALADGKLTREVIAYVAADWTSGANLGARCFFREDDDAPVFGKAYLNDSLLKPAGIGQLYGTAEPEHTGEHAMLAAWDRVLKSGTRAAVAGLRIDRVLVEIEWLAHSGQWRVQRLIAPRAVRAPAEEGEYVDWVDAQVVEVKPALTQFPSKPGKGPDPSYELKVHFRHSAIGQFDVRYWTQESFLERDGLAAGVPLIVRLKAKGAYWNINRIHRSTPLRPVS